MSINLSTIPEIQLYPDGRFVFKSQEYYLKLGKDDSLTKSHYQRLAPHFEKLFNQGMQQKQQKKMRLSKSDQSLLRQVQKIAHQAIDSMKTNETYVNDSFSSSQSLHFPWPSNQLKNHLTQSILHLRKSVQNLKIKTDSHSIAFLEELKEKLNEMKNGEQSNLKEFLDWEMKFSQEKMKTLDVPDYFKRDFNQLLLRMQQATSWAAAQKTLEKSLKKCDHQNVLNQLLNKTSSHQERQLGSILLKIHQAKTPQFLQIRLQSAKKLFLSISNKGLLNKKAQHTLQALLQELLFIAKPLISRSLTGRITSSPHVNPAQSHLKKLKEILRLIFASIIQFFQHRSHWNDAQQTPDYLLVEHKDFDDYLLAREEVFRHDSVSNLLASKEASIQELMKQNPVPDIAIHLLEEAITSYESHHQGQTWIPANQVKEDYIRYQKELKKDKNYIPALINSHIHQIKTESDILIIHRSGSISDAFNESTSLDQLKIETMNSWKDLIEADSFLEFRSKALTHISEQWNSKLYQDIQTIDKRQQHLEDQMVQLIANEVRANILDLTDSSRFSLPRLMRTIHLTQIGLLNPLEKHVETSGFHYNERNQMLDMAAIFQHFNGKKIRFKDVSAPFMKNDTIYLPLSFVAYPKTDKPIANPDIEEPFTLSCTFFNTSVQGLLINQNEQKSINEKAIKQLLANLESIKNFIEKHPETQATLITPLTDLYNRLKELEDKLEQGETGYAIATDIAFLQHDMQGMIGVNCSDGQDRTSYLIAKMIAQHIERQIAQNEQWSQTEKIALNNKIISDLMDMEHGLASRIVYQSSGRKALRLQEKYMMGISESNYLMDRMMHFAYSFFASIS